jgi:DNA-binding beta-propeller fold protein YncE
LYPYGIAVDGAGRLYVASQPCCTPRIDIYETGAVNLILRDSIAGPDIGLSNPRGIALDRAGRLYIANAGFFNIVV